MTTATRGDGFSRGRYGAIAMVVGALLLVGTSAAVMPILSGADLPLPGATPAPARQGSDLTTGPPAAAAPAAQSAILIEGDEALGQRARDQDWPGTGTAADPVRITGLALDTVDRSGLRLRGTTLHVTIEGALVHVDGAGDGIHLDDVRHVTITDTRVTGGTAAVRVVDSSHVHMANNTFEAASYGVLLQAVEEVTVRDSHLAFNRIGLYAEPAREGHGINRAVTVTANTVLGNDAQIDRGGGVVLAGRDHVVSQNVLEANGNAGIWVVASGTTVTANRLDDGLHNGIVVQRAKDVTVTGNKVYDHAGQAIRGHQTSGLVVDDNKVARVAEVAIRVAEDDGSTIRANHVEAAATGIVGIGSKALVVVDNHVTAAGQAIDLVETDGARLQGNVIKTSTTSGISLFAVRDTSLEANHVFRGGVHGIYVGKGSTDVRFEGDQVFTTPRGITIDGSSRDLSLHDVGVWGPCQVGVHVVDADRVVLQGARVERCDHGVHVAKGDGHRVEDSRITANLAGVGIGAGAGPVTAEGGRITKNTVGVHIVGSSGHKVHGLDVAKNTQGVLLLDADRVDIAHNWVRDNRVGLHFVNATQNRVWDNLVVNDELPGDQDHLVQNSPGNTWNVTERTGPNVVGGPRIGGNLWGDYNGPDADDDGLGDIPYWPVPLQLPENDVLGISLTLDGPLDMHPIVVDGDPEAADGPGGAGGADDDPRDDGPRLPLSGGAPSPATPEPFSDAGGPVITAPEPTRAPEHP